MAEVTLDGYINLVFGFSLLQLLRFSECHWQQTYRHLLMTQSVSLTLPSSSLQPPSSPLSLSYSLSTSPPLHYPPSSPTHTHCVINSVYPVVIRTVCTPLWCTFHPLSLKSWLGMTWPRKQLKRPSARRVRKYTHKLTICHDENS